MALKSNLLSGDKQLEACAVRDPAHILPGSVGTHVARIQIALAILDGASIDSKEAKSHTYGPSTAAAVLAYKKKRNIINWSYQQQADDPHQIVLSKKADGTCDYSVMAIVNHGWD